jgi:lipopolysaccharide/colanic/teichoic acid biosynthesis glycosyltransferase
VFPASLLGRRHNHVPDPGVSRPVLFAKDTPLGPTVGGEAGIGSRTETPDPAVSHGQVPVEPDRGFYLRRGKRALDLALGAAGLLVALPLYLLCALAIKLDTPGPVLYCSTRVGLGGRTFTFYKLRSMIHGADKTRHQIAHLNEVSGPVFKIARDPRITRVGRILRRTSLDELPQIFNVLKGDMSLVGPRPPIPQEVVKYEPWQLRRLSVRPGITCLWQVSGRSRLGFDEWMRLDMEYVERRSFGLDLSILARTIPAVFGGKGAY